MKKNVSLEGVNHIRDSKMIAADRQGDDEMMAPTRTGIPSSDCYADMNRFWNQLPQCSLSANTRDFAKNSAQLQLKSTPMDAYLLFWHYTEEAAHPRTFVPVA